MHIKSRHTLSVLGLSALALTACVSVRAERMPVPIELKVRAEPAFQKISYAALPTGIAMHVRLDTAEVIGQLKQQLHGQFSPDRSAFTLQQEELVLSNGTPYRRIWVNYLDTATWSTHGSCGQNIYAWFPPTGELAEIFVEQLVCPI